MAQETVPRPQGSMIARPSAADAITTAREKARTTGRCWTAVHVTGRNWDRYAAVDVHGGRTLHREVKGTAGRRQLRYLATFGGAVAA